MKKENLIKNIGKQCKILESPILLSGTIGTIIDIWGNENDGFRYEIEVPPTSDILGIKTYYIPILQCEIIDDTKPS